MADYKGQFVEACKCGQMEVAKRLVQDHQVDVHVKNEYAFQLTCRNGYIEIAKWLAHDHQVDVHVDCEFAFILACNYRQDKIIKLFTETCRYSQSPYYYYNQTAYILNH
jgi:hypothetical protein